MAYQEVRVDKKNTDGEFDFADTLFVRDIDSRVFQAIAYKCIEQIDGVTLATANLIDNLLGRETTDRMKGVTIDQDQKNHSVNIRIEVNIAYGLSIPEKAEEIQNKVTKEVSMLTGLHVASVHVVFKSIIPEKLVLQSPETEAEINEMLEETKAGAYSDEF